MKILCRLSNYAKYLIYNISEIAKTTLDNWDENFSHDQIQEMLWRNCEIKNTLSRLEK
jgi:hypothetical protein